MCSAHVAQAFRPANGRGAALKAALRKRRNDLGDETPMNPKTLRPVLVRTCVALAACVALAPQSLTAEIPQPVEHLVGRSLDASGTYAGPIDIVIGRWSTQEEFESVRKPIMGKNGPAAILALLERVRIHAGSVLTPGVQNAGERAL